MGEPAKVQGWSEIDLRDIGLAYHKAKCDAFFERSTIDAIAFADYEEQLESNLRTLLQRVRAGQVAEILTEGSKEYEVIPKKLAWEVPLDDSADRSASAHLRWVRTSADRRFEHLENAHDPRLELRVCSRFTVDAQVVGALWINLIGHRLDETLGEHAYGSRLRRYRSQTEPGNPRRAYHLEARGSFEPYIHPYRRWRADAMRTIRTALDENKSVAVLMLDLRGYYHSVDPRFVTKKCFLDELSREPRCKVELADWELEFTGLLVDSFVQWGKLAREGLGLRAAEHWGLPIGSAASRVLANVLLLRWDRAVCRGLAPIFYGRYVDDMILVLRDPESLRRVPDLFSFLHTRLVQEESGESLLVDLDAGSEWGIDFGEDYSGKSNLRINPGKLRVFFLEGQSGRDFLSTLDREAREISSERRFLPEPDLLDDSFAARLLTATEQPGNDADSFGRAGALTVRRFAWSVALRKAEILALDLPPFEWGRDRRKFYGFAVSHVVCADKLVNHADTLGRLLSLAVSCGDPVEALIQAARGALLKLEPLSARGSLRINGEDVELTATDTRSLGWAALLKYFDCLIYQSIARAWTSAPAATRAHLSSGAFVQVCERRWRDGNVEEIDIGELLKRDAVALLLADLARTPIAEFVLPTLAPPDWSLDWFSLSSGRTSVQFLEEVFREKIAGESTRFAWVTAFVDLVTGEDAVWPQLRLDKDGQRDYTPFFFPTRPVGARVIAQAVPETTAKNPTWASFTERALPSLWADLPPDRLWACLLRALRCIAVRNIDARRDVDNDPSTANMLGQSIVELPFSYGTESIGESSRPRVAVANVRIEDDWWAASAAGKPRLTTERYDRLARLVNNVIALEPRPHYLVLPELSVPRRWIRSIARFLNDAHIGLVAGVEYGHGRGLIDRVLPSGGDRLIANQVVVSLLDTRLGYPAVGEVWQTKTRPAPHEDEQLHSVYGRKWNGGLGTTKHPRDLKPIFHHGTLYFGLLVCSELRNINYRCQLQGNVDLALVVSWNRDLATFEPLLESAALDIHAYVGLVNNARYGDTRIRIPAREPHQRDVCRVRGGLNDYCVVAELDVLALRQFHSHELPWAHENDVFKPVPEGFNVSKERWRIPGTSSKG